MSQIEVVRTGHGVVRITLNRPERLNAISPGLLRDLMAAADELKMDNSVRVVAIQGAGDSFSAGADLPEFASELASTPEAASDLGRLAMEAVAELPQITIAVIHGHCVGGAAVLAAVCDLRVCAADSRFWIPELEAGIPLAWGGMHQLVRLIGETMAADLVLTCRPFGADEALRTGFVSRVLDVEGFWEEADRVVTSIASKASHPLLVTKRQLRAIRSGRFEPTLDAAALLESFSDPEAGQMIQLYTDRLR